MVRCCECGRVIRCRGVEAGDDVVCTACVAPVVVDRSDDLEKAIELARSIGVKSWRWVDPLNIRIGRWWVGETADGRWAVWVHDRSEAVEPSGALLDEYDHPAEAVASALSLYVPAAFEDLCRQNNLECGSARC